MIKLIREIWNSKNRALVFFLILITLGGIYLYLDRPSISTSNDLTEVKGTLNHIDQELVYIKKIRKTERDSTYHIYLNEYPSKFQVSYMPYYRKEFYRSAKHNDQIILHIAKENIRRLKIPDAKIRSFSLTVNDKVYLSADSGARGFGKGYFELGMIFISLTINFFLIRDILNKKSRPKL
ncbi:hypothetical protein [uncultured Marixanthomonas sp.]|uniref:hypothetical protein n=1 Tax=uncultured Marixanthomonas sp. TaxID=757245 RepID=UPI0030DBF079|tara:strand:- start:15267 stop:15806 length:540 start_codon:yes stop_codon:yes gene_type:complete